MTILENHFGAEGYMAWFKLLERLSTTQDHTISCRDIEETEFLAAKLRLTPERFEQIIGKVARLEGIDRELWESDRVIWCQNLVDNLKPVYDNRRQELPTKPPPHKSRVSTVKNPVSRIETPVSSPESTQREVVEVVERGSRGREDATHPTLPHSASGGLVGAALQSFKLLGENLISCKDGDLIEAENACRKFSPEWIQMAVREACAHNKLQWSYVAAILRRWESETKQAGQA